MPGQRLQDEVGPHLLPRLKIPRKGHTSPPAHRQAQQRRPKAWRGFAVRIYTGPDSAAVHALHTFLREAARRYDLTIARVDEVNDPE
jgi:hypothetical protein